MKLIAVAATSVLIQVAWRMLVLIAFSMFIVRLRHHVGQPASGAERG